MATIRAFTTIEQSRKLAKILPIESADMCWQYQKDRWVGEPDYQEFPQFEHATDKRDIPCWSFAALLGVLPNIIKGVHFKTLSFLYEWHCAYMNGNGEILTFDTSADNPVDACVDMIEKLNELNLL